MSTAIADFSEFVVASEARADVLTDIEGFVSRANQQIDLVEKSMEAYYRSLRESERTLFVSCCSPDGMRRELFDEACGMVDYKFAKKLEVDVGSVKMCVAKALGWEEPEEDDRTPMVNRIPAEALVVNWSADKIRHYFERKFGDVREVRIRQLREKALRIAQYTEPEKSWQISTGTILEQAYDSKYRLRMYSGSNADDLLTVLRFVIHLATGQDPKDIKAPTIYGVNDRERYCASWERSEAFKRQKMPCPGVVWFRFNSSGRPEVGLEPAVLELLTMHWSSAKAFNFKFNRC